MTVVFFLVGIIYEAYRLLRGRCCLPAHEPYDERGDVVAMRTAFRPGGLHTVTRVLMFLLSWRLFSPTATMMIAATSTAAGALVAAERASTCSAFGKERGMYKSTSFTQTRCADLIRALRIFQIENLPRGTVSTVFIPWYTR